MPATAKKKSRGRTALKVRILRRAEREKQLLKGIDLGEAKPFAVVRLRKTRAELAATKLAYLTERLGGVVQVADAVHADKSRVSRWSRGARPDERNYRAISDLEFIFERLSRFLDDAAADTWLNSGNAFLGGARPIDLIYEGRIVEVLSAADQEEAGSFA